ncbi:MAG: hypothetical protein EXS32_16245 [Opitutus sp.]|nr:hypothetical protein [Opitutus sp.]
MISSLLRSATAATAALVLTLAATAAETAIIAKARAHLGPEAALNGVKSIHFVGTLITVDPTDATKQSRAAVEIFFQAADQQRIKATSDKIIEITALNGYDAWTRLQDPADASKWQQTLLVADQIKRLRATTWENLAFYRGLERRGGRIEEQGAATIDGIACQKVAFIHAPNIIFTRFFEAATGRLVYTETESGATMRESGEQVAGGIRFPKTLVQTTKLPNGLLQTVTLNFEKVTVNEVFPGSLFQVPALSPK